MHLPDNFEFMCPVKTGSGTKALEHLPSDLGAMNARKPIIITDKKTNSQGLIKHIVNAFKASGMVLGVYDGVDQASGLDTIKELSKIYQDKGFDSIIAVGNGNVTDVAKILNIVVSGRPEDLKGFQGEDKVANPLKPLIYIPVSTGSARETSGMATLGDMFYSSKFLMPDIVVIDPRMLKEDEPERVINTAMAALTYAAEVYSCNGKNPLSGAYAHTAIDFVMSHLVNVIKESFDEKGRLRSLINRFQGNEGLIALANASSMAGCVFSNAPEGIASRLGEEVGRLCNVLPGIAKGIILPYALEYKAYREGRELEKLMLPVAGLDVYCGTPVGQRFDSAIGKIRHLQNELYILTSATVPRTLEDAKLPKEELRKIAEAVTGDGTSEYDKDACMVILEHAFEGKPVTP